MRLTNVLPNDPWRPQGRWWSNGTACCGSKCKFTNLMWNFMDVFFYTLFWWKLMGTNWWWWWWCSSGCGGCGGCVHLMLSSVRQMMIIQFQEQNICQTCSGHYSLQANRLPEHYPLNLLRQLSNLRPWHYGHAILGVPSSKLGTNSSHGTLPMAFGNTEYIEYIHVWTFQLYNYMLVIPKGTHSWPKKKKTTLRPRRLPEP